jgi:hypothetical protein
MVYEGLLTVLIIRIVLNVWSPSCWARARFEGGFRTVTMRCTICFS